MSEQLLKALMQLFALASSDDDLTNESRSIVEEFLNNELNSDLVPAYLKLYDENIVAFHSKNDESGLDSQHVKSICQAINESLIQKQKVIVLVRLLEYIFADGNISSHELSFLHILCDIFNVPEKELNDCLAFAKSDLDTIPEGEQVMEISAKQKGKSKWYELPNFENYGMFLYVESVNLYVFRHFSNKALYLNGQLLKADVFYIFNQGSSIRGDISKTLYYSDIASRFLTEQADGEIRYEAKAIAFDFPNGKRGLHSLSFQEPGGRLIGIMGGSGAGKSTLLNVLNGIHTPTEGAVTINGLDIHRQKNQLKGVIGYVSQDDLLIEDLTVFQNLYYNAQLCFADTPNDEIERMVDELLTMLGMPETRNLKVGNPIQKVISGGQRKRLNIALELIREPSVLFVDEPTSGLSSRDSENIMDLLKQLSLKGKLVFVVIHQPSSEIFKMFDKLLLLDLGGYPIFYGDPLDSVLHFKRQINHVHSDVSECQICGNVNPEQIFNIIESKVLDEYGNATEKRKTSPKEWNALFLETIQRDGNDKLHSTNLDSPKSTLSTPSLLSQFLIFLKRDVLSKLTNNQYVAINFLEAPILALILSYFIKFSANDDPVTHAYRFISNDNLPAYLFMAVVVSLFIGLTVSAEEIIRDRRIRKRERFLNLSKGSYLWSKILIMFTLSAIQSLSFILVGNAIMEVDGMFWDYFGILFSTACFANLLGLNISSAFNSAVTIYILIPFLIIPQLIFSGVIVKFDKLNPSISSRSHVPFIGEIMASRWAFEALAVNQFKNNPVEERLFDVDKKISQINFHRSYWIPELEARMAVIEKNAGKKKAERARKVVLNELRYMDKSVPFPAFPLERIEDTLQLTQGDITLLNAYLKDLKKSLNTKYLDALDERDYKIAKIESEVDTSGYFNALKQHYVNEGLSDMVLNKAELNKIVEVNGHLIQQESPVFQDAKSYRSHFFSPNKLLFGNQFDTYWFNIIVIWGMTLTLIIMLYLDAFKWVLNQFEKIGKLFKR